MGKFPTITLRGPSQRDFAHRVIEQAPDGYVVKVAAETRRDAQNRKLWPMLTDLQHQVEELTTYSVDDIKLRFLHALGAELRFLPALEGQGMFPIGLRSSTLTVDQFSALVELLYAYGARHGVRWSDPAERTAA